MEKNNNYIREYIEEVTGETVKKYPVYVIPGRKDRVVARLDRDISDGGSYVILEAKKNKTQINHIVYGDGFLSYDDKGYTYLLRNDCVSRTASGSKLYEEVFASDYVINNLGFLYYIQRDDDLDLGITRKYPYISNRDGEMYIVSYDTTPYSTSIDINVSDDKKRVSFEYQGYEYKITKSKKAFIYLPEKINVCNPLKIEGYNFKQAFPQDMIDILMNVNDKPQKIEGIINNYNSMKSNSR